MVSLGLLDGDVDELIAEEAYKPYYMHRTGHWLGMDVHDVGLYNLGGEPRPLQAGMVTTIEPGLYIPIDDEDAPEALRGIGVRIEDDVMIGGGTTILPRVRIGERSFIAAGAVVTKDVPPRSFVAGVPGRISPLPPELDRPNDRRLTIQPLDLWHPEGEYPGDQVWPDHWGENYFDSDQ